MEEKYMVNDILESTKGKFNNIPRCNFRSRKHATKTNNTTNKK